MRPYYYCIVYLHPFGGRVLQAVEGGVRQQPHEVEGPGQVVHRIPPRPGKQERKKQKKTAVIVAVGVALWLLASWWWWLVAVLFSSTAVVALFPARLTSCTRCAGPTSWRNKTKQAKLKGTRYIYVECHPPSNNTVTTFKLPRMRVL